MTAWESFEALLAKYYVVRVGLKQADGLVVPACASPLGGSPVLDYANDGPAPAEGLDVCRNGIQATLFIAGRRVATFVPWAAVQGMGGVYLRPGAADIRVT